MRDVHYPTYIHMNHTATTKPVHIHALWLLIHIIYILIIAFMQLVNNRMCIIAFTFHTMCTFNYCVDIIRRTSSWRRNSGWLETNSSCVFPHIHPCLCPFFDWPCNVQSNSSTLPFHIFTISSLELSELPHLLLSLALVYSTDAEGGNCMKEIGHTKV